MNKSAVIQKLSLWFPVLIWAGVIFAFSSIQTQTVSEIDWRDFVFKKLAHVIEYAILATLLYRAFNESSVTKRNAGYAAIILCFLYGISDEFHQSFTPGRGPSFRDVIFDTIGAGLAIYLIWNILPKAPMKLKTLLTKLQIL